MLLSHCCKVKVKVAVTEKVTAPIRGDRHSYGRIKIKLRSRCCHSNCNGDSLDHATVTSRLNDYSVIFTDTYTDLNSFYFSKKILYLNLASYLSQLKAAIYLLFHLCLLLQRYSRDF